jgi:predicted glycoside hydrolase/deacetylase ChbG (UPF0249 family)
MLKLIVTADDFGIGLETSKGILKAHLRGPVTATSLMSITGDHVARSIPLLAAAPNLEVGLHLVLTDCGHPPMTVRKSSGLLTRDGRFHTNAQLWLRALAGIIDKSAVIDEISAQAREFRFLTGRDPAYVDAHHHAHQLPIIRDALAEMMQQHAIPPITRTTIEPPAWRKPVSKTGAKRRLAERIGKAAAESWKRRGIAHNDYFFGMLSPAQMSKNFPWKDFLGGLPDSGIIEWVVHPGLPDETLVGRDDYQAGREKELKALTDSTAVEMWEKFRENLARKSELFSNRSRG